MIDDELYNKVTNNITKEVDSKSTVCEKIIKQTGELVTTNVKEHTDEKSRTYEN